jgi:SAM-dependent methyltransferase
MAVPHSKKRMLNAGAGSSRAGRLNSLITAQGWDELRLDIDPNTNPDLVGSVCDLSSLFPPGSFDAIVCSHVLEHLYAHEAYPALAQFRAVLKPDGFALIMCPDLMAAAEQLLEKGLAGIVYNAPVGPIRVLDLFYGHSQSIEQGHHYMAHRTGFTSERLGNLLLQAGFPTVNTRTDQNFELCAVAFMEQADQEGIQSMLASSGFDLREAVA